MKKVLLSSLVAVMAVTSANAKIASTNYADQAAGAALSTAQAYTDRKTGDVSSLATDADLKVVKGVSDLTAAVKKLDEAVNLASGDLDKLGALATLNTVGTGQIDDNAVTTPKIANANVTADKLAANSVTTAKIANANVTADKLAANSVTTAKIVDAAVTEAKLDTTLAKKINDTSTLSQANKQAIDEMTTGETSILKQAKDYTDEEVGKKQDIITDLDAIRAGAAKGATAVQNFSSLSNNAENIGTNDGSYVTSVVQSDGKITSSVVAFSRTVAKDDTNAPQTQAVKTYVDDAVDGLKNGAVALNTAAIGKNTQAIEGITNADEKEDGSFVLTKKVVDGVATYAWEQIDRDLAN